MENGRAFPAKDLAVAAGKWIVQGAAAFFCARTALLGEYLPLGLAVAAGMPAGALPAVLGALLGYLFPVTGSGGFRYAIAVLAIGIVKWLVGDIVRVKHTEWVLSGLCLAVSLATGFAVLAGSASANQAWMLVTEAFLAAGCTWMLHRGISLLPKVSTGLSGTELCTVIIAGGLLLSGTLSIRVGDFSLGRILLLSAVLAAAGYGGVQVGAVAGVTAAFFAALPGGDAMIVSLAFAMCGLFAGIFSGIGRFATAGTGVLCFGLWWVMSGGGTAPLASLLESVIAAAMFLICPASVCRRVAVLFAPSSPIREAGSVANAVTNRLAFAADAMQEVSETVERVAQRLNHPPAQGEVLRRVELSACSGCALRLTCWESAREETAAAVFALGRQETAPEGYQGRCLRLERFAGAARREYASYAATLAAQRRLEEIRTVVTDQFSGVAGMLADLSEEFSVKRLEDPDRADAVERALKEAGIPVTGCDCTLDEAGRVRLQIRLRKTSKNCPSRREVLHLVEGICNREFDPPTVEEAGSEFLLSLWEKANFFLDFGACQLPFGGGSVCGDSYQYFFDSRGRANLLLCDGMGTGGRAAVDSAMASGLMERLLKAGFSPDCALRILNAAMSCKSTDESFSTVDAACLDLFTGRLELFKAGAAPTIVRRSGKTARADCRSMPAGILQEVAFDRAAIHLSVGDVLVMVTDGATESGSDWISDILLQFGEGTAKALAGEIADGARRRRTDGHEDDITVLVAIVRKAV